MLFLVAGRQMCGSRMLHIAVSLAVGRMQCNSSFRQALSPATRASCCGFGERGAGVPSQRSRACSILLCQGAKIEHSRSKFQMGFWASFVGPFSGQHLGPTGARS